MPRPTSGSNVGVLIPRILDTKRETVFIPAVRSALHPARQRPLVANRFPSALARRYRVAHARASRQLSAVAQRSRRNYPSPDKSETLRAPRPDDALIQAPYLPA